MNAASPPALRDDARIICLVGIAHAISHFFHLILAPLFPWLREAFQLACSELGYLMIRAAAPPNVTGRVVGVVYSGLDTGLAIPRCCSVP